MSRVLNHKDRLVIASHNQGKVIEITDLLRPLAIDTVGARELGLDEPEAFESLSATIRFGLPIIGALLIAVFYERLGASSSQVGIPFVMERLAWHQASMPTRNAIAQFFGAIVSLASGHSLGREGPAVHLGAHVSSVIGERLQAPHNTTRILVACGTAAAIAASFNTPIAGVIFAMEVVLMEYTIAGFTPVIVASVTAAWMSRAAYGTAAAFDVPALEMGSLFELPFLIFVGAAIGTLAAAFTWTVANLKQRAQPVRLLWRFLFAGVVTGLCALVVPEVMGLGYDTVEMTFSGQVALGALLVIVAFKWIASATGAAMGLPAGLIGPTLVQIEIAEDPQVIAGDTLPTGGVVTIRNQQHGRPLAIGAAGRLKTQPTRGTQIQRYNGGMRVGLQPLPSDRAADQPPTAGLPPRGPGEVLQQGG